jgi:transcriptional regulator with XRE-family HTH domain
MSAREITRMLAVRARSRRLARAWTQAELAERSGMSLSSLRRFERTGQIALLSLVRLAIALDALDEVMALFPEEVKSLDQVLSSHQRQRGRRS